MAEDFHRAGALRYELHFQQQADVDDGFGNTVPGGAFETQFTLFAAMRPLRGSETVTAARLNGQQPYIVSVRYASRLSEVTAAWRLVDVRDVNRVFAITAPPADPDGRRQWIDIMVVEGQAS